MKDYKLVREEEGAFVVHDGKSEFRVPMDRLAHKTVTRIRQHFADGGEVRKPAIDPGDVGDLSDETRRKMIEEAYQKYDPTGYLRNGGDPITQGGDPTMPAVVPPDADAANAARLAAAPPPPPAPEMAPPTPTPKFAPTVQGVPEMLARPTDAPPAPLAQPQAQPQGRQPVVPQFPQDTTGAQIARSAQDEAHQMGTVSEAEARGQARVAATQNDAAQARMRDAADLQNIVNQANAGRQAQIDAYNDPKNDLKPENFWETRTTGQKIAASIGMILSGIGSGLTGQPNMAVQMIDKAIERDLDAQKGNLTRKHNALTMSADAFKDYMAGRHMATAQAYDAVTAMVQAQLSTTKSDEARAQGQALIAQLQGAAAQKVQEAGMRALQMEQERRNMAAQQQMMEATQALMQGLSGGKGFDRGLLELPAFKDYRERAVDLPDGSFALAGDKQEADKARESYATVSRLKSKLTRYNDMLANGSPETTDSGSAEEMHADLLAEMGHLHDLNRLSDKDLELFKEQVPDISKFWSLKALDKQRLRGLGKSIDDKVWSINSQLLHRPGARPNG